MPYLEPSATAGKKRKRDAKPREPISRRSADSVGSVDSDGDGDDIQGRILLLENQILQSRQHYNNLATLIAVARGEQGEEPVVTALIALCRTYCRLLTSGALRTGKGLSEEELVVRRWLKSRYAEYTEILLPRLQTEEDGSVTLKLGMRLVKAEVESSNEQGDKPWKTGLFPTLVKFLLHSSTDVSPALEEFVEEYFSEYHDVRYHAINATTDALYDDFDEDHQSRVISNCLKLLLSIESPSEILQAIKSATMDDEDDFFGRPPQNTKNSLYNVASHKKHAQEAWLALLRAGLDKQQRKTVLGVVTHQIVPFFVKVELLMDFLTDSFDVGGATSLLALSGLFYLIQEKNLDYPSFYHKLYSLLDDTILHSKHRSRFFRLLDTFMSSTHLSAALVASFIKRLSRLALHAPPAGIVVIVPWTYNMLKKHPACTFMIHRETRDPQARESMGEDGSDDPFDITEEDPMETGAIDSCLWELETLQSHYHPNVATLAKIISEQFTKQSYNLEDFLDHSYNGLIEAELGKELKKAPVVEFEIPKRIFLESNTEPNQLGALLTQVMVSRDG